jgi:photosystem II stability/assembly factor-like uncharacterized protein
MLSQSKYWQQTSLTNGNVRRLLVNTSGDIHGLTNVGMVRSTDNGMSWTTKNTSLYSLVLGDSDYLFGGTLNQIQRSTDNGDSWSSVFEYGTYDYFHAGIAADLHGLVMATYYCFGPGRYCNPDGFVRTTDAGAIWEVKTTLVAQVIAIQSREKIFGVQYGRLFVTSNLGNSWVQADSGLPLSVQCLAFFSATKLLAGTSTGLYYSYDGSRSWFRRGLDSLDITCLLINRDGAIFAGTNVGVFQSLDSSLTWKGINSGLIDSSITTFALAPNGYLFAGTFSAGVFRSVTPTTDVRAENGHFPRSFSLDQNYPNPFNPSTTITFSISQPSYVTLMIFNVLGQEVASLYSDHMTTGKHQIRWDASNLQSGVYLCRLQAGKFVDAKKLLLLR